MRDASLTRVQEVQSSHSVTTKAVRIQQIFEILKFYNVL